MFDKSDFKKEVERQKELIVKAEEFFDSLPVSEHYKYLFFRMVTERGIKKFGDFGLLFEGIYKHRTDEIQKFMENKPVGIEHMFEIATLLNEDKQREYFNLIMAKGVKKSRDDFDLLVAKEREERLSDQGAKS